MFRNFRTAWAVVASAAIVLATPTQSYAIFHWFRNACGCGSQPAAYAPPVVEAPLAAPTVVNYVPQTCYRTQYVTVPVTTYRPTTGRDPCTGCPVTTMRPTIAYVQQARMVPYTTYRPVVTSGCNPCGGATVGYAPGVGYAAPSSSCSGCSASPAAPAALPYYNNAAPISSAPAASSSGAPTLAPGVNPGVSNFQQRPIFSGESSGASSESRQKPITLPGSEGGNGSSGQSNGSSSGSQGGDLNGPANANPTSAAPRLINPDDRTTQRLSVPVRYAVHRVSNDQPSRGFSPIEWPRDAKAIAKPVSAPADLAAPSASTAAAPSAADADGWRPSQR